MQGPFFPSLTPPSARGSVRDALTPDLSGFKGAKPSGDRLAGDTPASGRTTPHTPVTPDTAAKAALQGKLDLTPATGAAKPGGYDRWLPLVMAACCGIRALGVCGGRMCRTHQPACHWLAPALQSVSDVSVSADAACCTHLMLLLCVC
jgi:hypothetical protein